MDDIQQQLDNTVDFYNQPTEPMPRLVLPSPPVMDSIIPEDRETEHCEKLQEACKPVNPHWLTLPLAVGLAFVFIQFLLLLRFICKVCGLPEHMILVDSIYISTNLFLMPFFGLTPSGTAPLFWNVEPYTLFAVLGYSLFSRCVVRCVKMSLRARKEVA